MVRAATGGGPPNSRQVWSSSCQKDLSVRSMAASFAASVQRESNPKSAVLSVQAASMSSSSSSRGGGGPGFDGRLGA